MKNVQLNNLPYKTWNSTKDLYAIIDFLNQDKVLVGSSDTVLGLLTNANLKGHKSLDNIKERIDKPYIILISDVSKLSYFADLNRVVFKDKLNKMISTYWPGPLTLILPANKDLPSYLHSFNNTVALRIPNHKGLLYVLKHFQGLFSTSANLAGFPVINSLKEIDINILKKVDCLVGESDTRESLDLEKYSTVSSTIVDFSKDKLNIVRQGSCIINM